MVVCTDAPHIKNVALLVKIMKTPYFKNSLKNPIFEIEDSNMDQMKENYLTHMNLVLTHFCQNVVLYGYCSQRLICKKMFVFIWTKIFRWIKINSGLLVGTSP